MNKQTTPNSINQVFASLSNPPLSDIEAFVLFCLDRIEHLIETDEVRRAFRQFKECRVVSPELAEQVNIASNAPLQKNVNATKAVAHAVCHCGPLSSLHFSDNRIENARLVALYCQWAVGQAEYPSDPSEVDSDDDHCEDGGREWLLRQVWSEEQAAQLAFICDTLPKWLSGDAKRA